MNDLVRVTGVRPEPTAEQLVAVTTALAALWPVPSPGRRTTTDVAWRFSGRRPSGRRSR